MAEQTSGVSAPNPVNFAAPPVSQVTLGVEFAGAVISEEIVLADFWREIREEFSDVQRQQLLSPMAETFEPEHAGPGFELRLGGAEQAQRYVFKTASTELSVQVQEDRFAFSWRRIGDDEEYPRYSWIRERFEEIYTKFINAADDDLLAKHPPTWCATTYDNRIIHPSSQDFLHGPLGDILCFIGRPESKVLPTVEDTMIRQRRIIRSEGGDPRGRLYIRATPAATPPPEFHPGYQLSLRVVSQPLSPDTRGVLECQDEGHNLIVETFRDITTEKMHQIWDLEED
ncbi:MAG: TIGR04255 family protein [Solirubrobacterales bacterium]|nr:TIGR04255 family protein [Solirubrobacterales bacterium]